MRARRATARFAGSGVRRVLDGRLVDCNNGPVPPDPRRDEKDRDDPTPTQKATALGATAQFGRCRVWIKVRNPANIAVQRERSGDWNS
jgi:hypothetical protein